MAVHVMEPQMELLLRTMEKMKCGSTVEDWQELSSTVSELAESALLPELEPPENRVYERSYFEQVAEVSAAVLKNAGQLLKVMSDTGQQRGCISKDAVVRLLLLCGEHSRPNLWVTDKSMALSGGTGDSLCHLYGHGSLTVLVAEHEDILKKLLKMLQHKLKKGAWKKYPGATAAYQFLLFKVKHPQLSDHLDNFLPMTLLMMDDFQTANRVAGLTCLQHIMTNVTRTELKWYGRAEVIYAALENMVYVHEAEMIKAVHPCIIIVLKTLESDPKDADSMRSSSRYDKILGIVLHQMEMEDKLAERREYIRCLLRYAEEMGVCMCRWMDTALRVIKNYAEVPDPPLEATRIYTLKVAKTLMQWTWPVIGHYVSILLESLLKILYDVTHDVDRLESSVREELREETIECLLVLKEAAPSEVMQLVQDLDWKEISDLDLSFLSQGEPVQQ